MGVLWSILFLWWVILCLWPLLGQAAKGFDLCGGICNCTHRMKWKNINCTLRDDQTITFNQRDISIPEEVWEFNIYGGNELTFPAKSFNSLRALSLISIRGARRIILEKYSFHNITSNSFGIKIQDCDELIIRSRTFYLIEGTVTINIENVKEIVIEPSSFSKLSEVVFRNIQRLDLKEKAFDITDQIIKDLGPVTMISFDNVHIPDLPKDTFCKALASVNISNSKIGVIHTESFKAREISNVIFHNTEITAIEERAFEEGTLVTRLEISKCNISKLQPRSIMVALNNFTLNHSNIRDIRSRAIELTVVQAAVTDNQMVNIDMMGFIFNQSNKIVFDNNIIDSVGTSFIKTHSSLISYFSFRGNEIHNIRGAAFGFLGDIPQGNMMFNDNSFSELCGCSLDDWVLEITNSSETSLFLDTSYCTINDFLGKCFSLKPDIINMRNFTNLKCQNFTECKIEDEIVNKTHNNVFFHMDDTHKQNWIIFIISIVGVFILGILITFIVLLVRGSRWLKEKGYFRNNMHYNNNDLSTEEEGTIVTIDEMEKLEIPEELTVEFLQMLAKRLDDPATNQEATEMVVRLYEMFIVDDSYENNNRQDEEAHLYEELGNLNLQIPPPPYEEENREPNNTAPRNILKMMEEKFSLTDDAPVCSKPSFVSEYSEPTDAAVHLYSELKSKSETSDKDENRDSAKSNGTLRNTLRPLPSKPTSKTFLLDEAGPSTKL